MYMTITTAMAHIATIIIIVVITRMAKSAATMVGKRLGHDFGQLALFSTTKKKKMVPANSATTFRTSKICTKEDNY